MGKWGDGGVEGCEGVDGGEQRAARAVHEAEGDNVDEAMEDDDNVSVQRAEGGSARRHQEEEAEKKGEVGAMRQGQRQDAAGRRGPG